MSLRTSSSPGFDSELCLLNVPAPIIAVSQSRTVVFTNRAAEKLLGHEDQVPSHDTSIGRQLEDLNIDLLYDETWQNVIDNFDSSQEGSSDDFANTDMAIHGVGAIIKEPGSQGSSRQFRIMLSSFAGEDGTNYILSFEHSLSTRINPFSDSCAPPREVSAPKEKEGAAKFYGYQHYRAATFDNANVAGYIISSDGTFYIPNKKIIELVGESMGGPGADDRAYPKAWLEFWDAEFKNRIGESDLPGLRLVRTRKSYTDCRYGLVISTTGTKYVLNASGYCLYHDNGQLLGGVCWFTTFEKLSEYLASEQKKDLRSHEMICNLLPHMVWTTAKDGVNCDWFSKRWYDYTGMTESEASGTGFTKAFHPDDYPRILKTLKEHIESKRELQLEMRFQGRDGSYRWMLARAAPLLGDDGQVLRWYGTNTDIHEATLARLKADSVKDQIMAVMAHANVSFFAVDRNREVTLAEGQALSIIGQIRETTGFVGADAVELARLLDLPGSGS